MAARSPWTSSSEDPELWSPGVTHRRASTPPTEPRLISAHFRFSGSALTLALRAARGASPKGPGGETLGPAFITSNSSSELWWSLLMSLSDASAESKKYGLGILQMVGPGLMVDALDRSREVSLSIPEKEKKES